MRKHLSSAKSAKDKPILVDLDDMALAMYADSMFMNDEEYDELKAQQQYAKDNRLRPSDVVTAVVFLAVCIAAIVFTIVFWNYK
jgi:hypothetical protein